MHKFILLRLIACTATVYLPTTGDGKGQDDTRDLVANSISQLINVIQKGINIILFNRNKTGKMRLILIC